MDDEFGTEEFKLRRNDHPDTSFAAAVRVKSATYEALAYKVIKGFGLRGCILDDLRAGFLKEGVHQYTQFINRRTGLHQKGIILDTGVRREGGSGRLQAVYVARELLTPELFQLIKDDPIARNECLFDELNDD